MGALATLFVVSMRLSFKVSSDLISPQLTSNRVSNHSHSINLLLTCACAASKAFRQDVSGSASARRLYFDENSKEIRVGPLCRLIIAVVPDQVLRCACWTSRYHGWLCCAERCLNEGVFHRHIGIPQQFSSSYVSLSDSKLCIPI